MRKMMAIGIGLAVATFGSAALAEDAKPAAAAASSSDAGGMKISAAALVGFGLNNAAPDGASESFNIYGLGFGARAGVSLPGNFYAGGTFVYHLGKSQDVGAGTSISTGVQYYGLEGGYNIASSGMTIRPYLGLGQVKAHTSCSGNGCAFFNSAESKAEIYLAPGVAVLLPLSGSIFAGGDARIVRVMTGDGDKGKASSLPSVFGTVGMSF